MIFSFTLRLTTHYQVLPQHPFILTSKYLLYLSLLFNFHYISCPSPNQSLISVLFYLCFGFCLQVFYLLVTFNTYPKDIFPRCKFVQGIPLLSQAYCLMVKVKTYLEMDKDFCFFNKCCVLMHMYEIQRNGVDNLTCKAEIDIQMQRINVLMLTGGRREWDELGYWN